LVNGILIALYAALASSGCAQILGTSDYKVNAGAFEEAGPPSNDDKPTRDDKDDDAQDAAPPLVAEAGAPKPTADSGGTTTPPPEPEDGGDGPTTEPPDAAPPPPPNEAGGNACVGAVGECTVAPQCGCAQGENCAVTNPATGATRCVTAGDVEPYAPCSETDGQCAAGYACVSGVCKRTCEGAGDSCDEGADGSCEQVTVAGEAAPGYRICQRTCDPVEPTHASESFAPCGAGANCVPGPDGVSACIGATLAGVEDAPCAGEGGPDAEGCAPGLACVDLPDGPVCQKSCDLAGSDCGAGQSCVPYASPVGAADREIGYCKGCQIPAGSECDPVAQCGCPAGEGCSIVDFTTGATACIAAGDVPEGGACTGGAVGECAPGNDCMVWLETGTCSRFCSEDADCPNPNGGCDVWGEWATPVSKMCLRGCDPRNPQSSDGPFLGCPEEQTCTPWYINENSTCVVPEAYGEEGDECFDEDNCAPGLGCGLDGGQSCARWCELGGSDCLADELCLPHARFQQFTLALPAAGVNMGICMLGRSQAELLEPLELADAPDGETAETLSTLEVLGFPGYLSHVAVGLTLSHSYVIDLDIFLVAPNGVEVQLVRGADLPAPVGQGFIDTMFDDISPVSVNESFEPFSDVVAPVTPMWYLPLSDENGVDPNGVWTLRVVDNIFGDTGTLTSWWILLF
jgi:subtilisin-like proprotein convertase family protein